MPELFFFLIADLLFAFALAAAALLPLAAYRLVRQRVRSRASNRKVGATLSSQKGQGLVELSLVLPLFLVIVVGVVEVANGFKSYMTVVSSARDGARLGSKGLATDDEIRALVLTETGQLRDTTDSNDVSVEHVMVDGVEAVKVTVCNDHTLLLDIPLLMPESFRMCSSTAMRTLPSGS